MAGVTAAAGQSNCTRPPRRPRMRGSGRGPARPRRLATRVLPRARAWASRASRLLLGEHGIEGGDRLVRQDQVRLLVESTRAMPTCAAGRRRARRSTAATCRRGRGGPARPEHRRDPGAQQGRSGRPRDHWPRRPASTAVTTGWEAGSGGCCQIMPIRLRSRWRAWWRGPRDPGPRG